MTSEKMVEEWKNLKLAFLYVLGLFHILMPAIAKNEKRRKTSN